MAKMTSRARKTPFGRLALTNIRGRVGRRLQGLDRGVVWAESLGLSGEDTGVPLGTKLAAEEAASDGWPCSDPGWAEAIKGNKIEHRMFRSITVIWRGRPLLDYGT